MNRPKCGIIETTIHTYMHGVSLTVANPCAIRIACQETKRTLRIVHNREQFRAACPRLFVGVWIPEHRQSNNWFDLLYKFPIETVLLSFSRSLSLSVARALRMHTHARYGFMRTTHRRARPTEEEKKKTGTAKDESRFTRHGKWQ